MDARDALYAVAKEIERKPRNQWTECERIAYGAWLFLTTAEINE